MRKIFFLRQRSSRRRSLLYGLIAVLLVLFTGCIFTLGSGVRGSGIVKIESRSVSGFSSISFKSVGKVTVQQTGKESLTITADDNILPLLESRVADNTLYLTIAKDGDMNPSKPINFVVEVKSLERLNTDGVGIVEAQGIQGKRLTVVMDGVGEVTISGSADTLDLSLSGVGSYQGEAFQTKQATVRNSGVGSAVVNVSEQLNADLSGVGSIEYVGSPQVRRSGLGLGTVKKR
ncbi:GIN domain-containing protein [Phormidesmis sp. 146-12]